MKFKVLKQILQTLEAACLGVQIPECVTWDQTFHHYEPQFTLL